MIVIISVSSAYAYTVDTITCNSCEFDVKVPNNPVTIGDVFRLNQVDGGTLIDDDEYKNLLSRGISDQEPNIAPHMKGYGKNIAYDSHFSFDGADITYLGNGGGNIKLRGWSSQDSFDVYCHGEYLTTVYLGKGHNGSFEVYVDIPLSHQTHNEEIIYEIMDGNWYIKTTRTYVP